MIKVNTKRKIILKPHPFCRKRFRFRIKQRWRWNKGLHDPIRAHTSQSKRSDWPGSLTSGFKLQQNSGIINRRNGEKKKREKARQ